MNNRKNKSKLNLFKNLIEKNKIQKKLQKQKEILLSSINPQNFNEKELLKFEEDLINNSFNSNASKNKLSYNNNNINIIKIKNNNNNQSFSLSPINLSIQIQENIKKVNNYNYYNQKSVNPSNFTDSNKSQDEGLSEYKINGYHPVHVGEILLDRYVIMQKIGFNNFSTEWLSLDVKYNNYVSIKIQKSSQQYIDLAYDEIEILNEIDKHNNDKKWVESLKEYWKDEPEKIKVVLRDHTHIRQLLNSFIYHGQNGKHFCMVYEIMGINLLEIIKKYNYNGISIPFVRIITKQLLIGLDYLHRICGIIHTDLKPENILVSLSKNELKEINENGCLDIDKLEINNDKNKEEFEDELSKISEKKKNKKFRKKQMKKLEKEGFNQEEIEKQINEIMSKKNNIEKYSLKDFLLEEKEISIDLYNYNINDLIQRPKILSLPKYNIKFNKSLYSENESCNSSNNNSLFELDINEYSNSIKNYIKEKNRIKTDLNYRKNLLIKQKLLNECKTEKDKIFIQKKIDENFYKNMQINKNINVKISDFGNACFKQKHYSSEIQTRQYRAPEVILGINYNESVDIWSLGCIIFELITGEYLFDPHQGTKYTKNDDHIASIIKLLGKMPKKLVKCSPEYYKYFTKDGKLKRFDNLKFFSLKDKLVKNYHIKENEAKPLSDFLKLMFEYYPEKRAKAKDLLKHPWLKMEANFDYYSSKNEKMILLENSFINNEKLNKNFNSDKIYFDNNNNVILYSNNSSFDSNNNKNLLYISEDEIYEADDEDNNEDNNENKILSSLNNSKSFLKEEEESGDENPDKIIIKNFNNSFAQYGQFVDLAELDRPNPQFENIIKKM